MKFEEVMPALRAGKKVSNKKWYGEWDSKDIIIVLSEGDVTALLFDKEWEVVKEYDEVEVWDWTIWNSGTRTLDVHRSLTEKEASDVLDKNYVSSNSFLAGRLTGTKRVLRRKK